jgi:hypothetical protein
MPTLMFTDNTLLRQAVKALDFLEYASSNSGLTYASLPSLEMCIAGVAKLADALVLFDQLVVDGYSNYDGSSLLDNPILVPAVSEGVVRELDLDDVLDESDLQYTRDVLKEALESKALWHFLVRRDELWKNNRFLESCFLNLLYDRGTMRTNNTETFDSMLAKDRISQLLADAIHENSSTLGRPGTQEHMFRVACIAMGIRAFLYMRVSEKLNLDYFPSIYRTPFIEYINDFQPSLRHVSEVAAERVGQGRDRFAESLGGPAGTSVIEAKLPVVLASVLKRSRRVNDIVPILLEIRRSKAATQFRRWSASVDSLAREGSIEQATRELHDMQHYLDGLADELNETKRYSLSVSVRPVSLSIPVRLPMTLERLLAKRRYRLVFLYDLFETAVRIRSIEGEVAKLLGRHLSRIEKGYFWLEDSPYEYDDLPGRS